MSALGPFSQTRFLGATIAQFTSKVGFDSQGTEITVELVEDRCAGTRIDYTNSGTAVVRTNVTDTFNPPPTGSPVQFYFGSFGFGGLLNNWEQTKDVSGGIMYTARIGSAKDVLEAGQIILQGYNESTLGVPNLFNTSHWCNEAGVTWAQIFSTIHGSLMSFKGHVYILDISEVFPYDIRFTGDSVGVLDAISTAAKNLGGIISVDLIAGVVIKVRMRVQSAQNSAAVAIENTSANSPPRNVLDAYSSISAFSGGNSCTSGIIRMARGVELVNEVTNAFITGEFVHALWNVRNGETEDVDETGFTANALITPYWGIDRQGKAILGSGDATISSGEEYKFKIENWGNAIPHINETYICSLLEMRAALDSFESWLLYMETFKSTLLAQVLDGVPGKEGTRVLKSQDDGGAKLLAKAINAGADPNQLLSNKTALMNAKKNLEGQKPWEILRRLFEFISSVGQEHYGKSFAIKLPQLECCVGETPPDTKQSWAQTDGAWTEDNVLGLANPSPGIEIFKLDDGRIGPILYYKSNEAIYLESIKSPYWSEDNRVWIKANFNQINFDDKENCINPRALVSFDGLVHSKDQEQDGEPEALDIAMLIIALAKKASPPAPAPPVVVTKPQIKDITKNLFSQFQSDQLRFGLAPMMKTADGGSVPLKNNKISYGPWYATNPGGNIYIRPSGKTHYERNTSLSPWNFGSIANMNEAASLIASGALVFNQEGESGSLTIAGGPSLSRLGSTIAGGAVLTGMDVKVDNSGVTTSYRFRTWTTNFGELARSRVQMLERAGQKQQQMQRAFNLKFAQATAIGSKRLMRKTQHPARTNSSSHNVFGMSYSKVKNNKDFKPINAGIANQTRMHYAYGGSENWEHQYLVGIEGLFRPIHAKPGKIGPVATGLEQPAEAGTQYPDGDGCPTTGGATDIPNNFSLPPIPPAEGSLDKWPRINAQTLNPFTDTASDINESEGGAHDMLYAMHGTTPNVDGQDSYIPDDINETRSDYRVIGLRGPILLTGWGYDTDGYPVPNAGEGSVKDKKFKKDWLIKPQTWKSGPIDLRWDDQRKVWTSPQPFKIVEATLSKDLIPEAFGGNGCATATLTETRAQEGQTKIKISDSMNQPIMSGRKVLAYFDPDLNEYKVIQAEFKPLCVVTKISGDSTGQSTYIPIGLSFAGAKRIPLYSISACMRTIFLESAWTEEDCSTILNSIWGGKFNFMNEAVAPALT